MQIVRYNKDIMYILMHDNSDDAYQKAKDDWCRTETSWNCQDKKYIKFIIDDIEWYYYDVYHNVYKYSRHNFTETDITKLPYNIVKKLYKNGSYYHIKE